MACELGYQDYYDGGGEPARELIQYGKEMACRRVGQILCMVKVLNYATRSTPAGGRGIRAHTLLAPLGLIVSLAEGA